MKNLILFFVRFYAFFLFLGLELISFSLIFQNNKFQRANFINSANYFSGILFTAKSEVTDYLYLKRINKELAQENAGLRSDKKSLSVEQAAALNAIHYKFISAKVINNSIYKANNYITLNKGSNDGVDIVRGVINNEGIVGIVKNVSPHFSSVMSLLHQSIRISVKIKQTNYLGSLRWMGPDPRVAILTDIPKHVSISKGNAVVTSGYSTFFPENVAIGQVQSFELEKGSNFYRIKVLLSTDFGKLNYAYIVNYKLKTEQLELEKATVEDE